MLSEDSQQGSKRSENTAQQHKVLRTAKQALQRRLLPNRKVNADVAEPRLQTDRRRRPQSDRASGESRGRQTSEISTNEAAGSV